MGRLSDRISVLRQRCVDGLGLAVFVEAHRFLKALQVTVSSRENDDALTQIIFACAFQDAEESGLEYGGEGVDFNNTTERRLESILGPDKMHFSSLIDQVGHCTTQSREICGALEVHFFAVFFSLSSWRTPSLIKVPTKAHDCSISSFLRLIGGVAMTFSSKRSEWLSMTHLFFKTSLRSRVDLAVNYSALTCALFCAHLRSA